MGAQPVFVGTVERGHSVQPTDYVLIESDSPQTFRQVEAGELSIGAVRDYTGRFPTMGVPMLNEPEVRKVTGDKWELAHVLGEDTLQTVELAPGEDLGALLNGGEGDAFVVKPRWGSGAKGVEVITSREQANRTYDTPMVVQPYADTTRLPAGIQGIGDFYRHQMTRQGVPREIRMYVNRNGDGSKTMHPIVRVGDEPGVMRSDCFTIVDPATVPDGAYALAARAFDKVAVHARKPHVSGAVDLICVGDEDELRVMELNTKEPAMPSLKEGMHYDGEDTISGELRRATGARTRQLVAQQLVRLARKP
jgi:hypothetical protein